MKKLFFKLYNQASLPQLFTAILLVSFLFFILSLCLSGWYHWKYLFFLLMDPADSFMDFFNPLQWTRPLAHAYSNYLNIYPPLTTLLCGLLGNWLNFDPQLSAKVVRSSISGQFALASFFVISIGSLVGLLYKAKMGTTGQKILFCITILLSAPFIYWFERANFIILALAGSLFFLLYYQDKKPWVRQVAITVLALSISVKLYPAVFGMCLLREKRWKDIVLLGGYTALFFLIPFLWMGGIEQIPVYIANLRQNANVFPGYGYVLAASSTLSMVGYPLLYGEYPLVRHYFQILLSVLPIILLAYGALMAYILKTRWKVLAMLCLLIVLVPGISFSYTALFMLIPLTFFLNEETTKTSQNLLYFILFCLIWMYYLPIKLCTNMGGYPVLLDNFCSRFALLYMYILLCKEGTVLLIKQYWEKHD